MIKLGQVWLLTIFIISFSASSSETVSSLNAYDVVEDYFALQNILGIKTLSNCRPSSSCLKVACSSLSRFECDEASEVEEISRACRGNWGGECILIAKEHVSRFELDDREEMIRLLESCRGLFELGCVDYTCQQVGRFGCDDLEEIIDINRMCAGR